MSFKIVEWNKNLDLSLFYKEAEKRGFTNNADQKSMVDCFLNERKHKVWILYYNEQPVGSVAAHTFDVMGGNSYRIAARTCVFTDKLNGTYANALRTKSVITELQNPTAQFLIPACLSWAPKDADLYITSNELEAGTQQRVHRIFGPLMQKQGIMEPVKKIFYRGTDQTVWRFYSDKFNKKLGSVTKWN
jgi:hypothetical protein